MPNFIKLVAVLLIAGFTLSACGQSGGDGAGGDTTSQETAPTDGTTAQ